MFGNPYAERKALEATYEDTAVISRPQPVKGPDGFTRPQPQPVYTGIICALSSRTFGMTESCLSSRTR